MKQKTISFFSLVALLLPQLSLAAQTNVYQFNGKQVALELASASAALTGELHELDFRITQVDAIADPELSNRSPIDNLADQVTVEVRQQGESVHADVYKVDAGHFRAVYIPTNAQPYEYRVTGTAAGNPIDVVFTCKASDSVAQQNVRDAGLYGSLAGQLIPPEKLEPEAEEEAPEVVEEVPAEEPVEPEPETPEVTEEPVEEPVVEESEAVTEEVVAEEEGSEATTESTEEVVPETTENEPEAVEEVIEETEETTPVEQEIPTAADLSYETPVQQTLAESLVLQLGEIDCAKDRTLIEIPAVETTEETPEPQLHASAMEVPEAMLLGMPQSMVIYLALGVAGLSLLLVFVAFYLFWKEIRV